jgi:hypothetical protein
MGNPLGRTRPRYRPKVAANEGRQVRRTQIAGAASLISSLVLMFFPVAFLGMYSPFAIRLLLHSPRSSGRFSGAVYGASAGDQIPETVIRSASAILENRAVQIGLREKKNTRMMRRRFKT